MKMVDGYEGVQTTGVKMSLYGWDRQKFKENHHTESKHSAKLKVSQILQKYLLQHNKFSSHFFKSQH
jgi:hypothetical protein